jgi:hypothetical protein
MSSTSQVSVVPGAKITRLKPISTLPHSPNWDSLQVCEFLAPSILAYCSNQSIFFLQLDLDPTPSLRLAHVHTLTRVKNTRCLALTLFGKDDDTLFAAVSLKTHLLVIV